MTLATFSGSVQCAVCRGTDHVKLVLDVLGRALGVTAAQVAVAPDEHGKPVVIEPRCDLRHSVAHTRDAVIVAWAHGLDVGVDIEPADRAVGDWALWRHALTPAEASQVPDHGPQRTRSLLRYWVRKEAIGKAAGLGLAVEPASIELAQDGTVVRVPSTLGRPSDWVLGDVAVPGFVAAVACRRVLPSREPAALHPPHWPRWGR